MSVTVSGITPKDDSIKTHLWCMSSLVLLTPRALVGLVTDRRFAASAITILQKLKNVIHYHAACYRGGYKGDLVSSVILLSFWLRGRPLPSASINARKSRRYFYIYYRHGVKFWWGIEQNIKVKTCRASLATNFLRNLASGSVASKNS